MDLVALDRWFRGILDIDGFARVDDSLNGVQVGRGPGACNMVAFAVDACAETVRRAAAAGAELLFVHHGLFWGGASRIEGVLRERLRLLLQHNMALYACHLPLDHHAEVGNNAVLAQQLGLVELERFGTYKGVKIGYRGQLDPPLPLSAVVERVLPDGTAPRLLLPGRAERISSVAVVSGGAAMEALQAIDAGIGLYVTGEPSHSIYHAAQEAGLAFLAAGHYATEVWGVKALAAKLARETPVQTLFIDVPTGL